MMLKIQKVLSEPPPYFALRISLRKRHFAEKKGIQEAFCDSFHKRKSRRLFALLLALWNFVPLKLIRPRLFLG